MSLRSIVAVVAALAVAPAWAGTTTADAAEDEASARVVIAVIDTGINPYHLAFRRPTLELPLDELRDATTGLAPRAIDLTFGPDYDANVEADDAAWSSIARKELVAFPGTNVLAISFYNTSTLNEDMEAPVRDVDGHGTATASTALQAAPDAIVVSIHVAGIVDAEDMSEAYAWAAAQPWIDVVSVSMGMHGNVPGTPGTLALPAITRSAWESGKIVVTSAGNDPSPLVTDLFDGPPWVLSITGTQAGGEAREVLASTFYPDFASNYTVDAASHDSVDEDVLIGGTSFSAPTAAGTIAAAVQALRADAGWTGGIADGKLVPPTGVDNVIVRAALNKSALYHEWDGYLVGAHYNGDVAVLPVVPFAEIGWGHLDARSVPGIVAVVQGNDLALPPPPHAKGLAAPYMRASYEARAAFWNDATVRAAEAASAYYEPVGRPGTGPVPVPPVPQDDAGSGRDAPGDVGVDPLFVAPGVVHEGILLGTPLDPSDVYAFNATAGQMFRADSAGALHCMYLYDHRGKEMDFSCATAVGLRELQATFSRDGTYYIEVTYLEPEPYRFRFTLDGSASRIVATPQDDAGSGGDAPDHAGGGLRPAPGVVHHGEALGQPLDPEDHYGVEVAAGQRLIARSAGVLHCLILSWEGSDIQRHCGVHALGGPEIDIVIPFYATVHLGIQALQPERYAFAFALDGEPPAVEPPLPHEQP